MVSISIIEKVMIILLILWRPFSDVVAPLASAKLMSCISGCGFYPTIVLLLYVTLSCFDIIIIIIIMSFNQRQIHRLSGTFQNTNKTVQ